MQFAEEMQAISEGKLYPNAGEKDAWKTYCAERWAMTERSVQELTQAAPVIERLIRAQRTPVGVRVASTVATLPVEVQDAILADAPKQKVVQLALRPPAGLVIVIVICQRRPRDGDPDRASAGPVIVIARRRGLGDRDRDLPAPEPPPLSAIGRTFERPPATTAGRPRSLIGGSRRSVRSASPTKRPRVLPSAGALRSSWARSRPLGVAGSLGLTGR